MSSRFFDWVEACTALLGWPLEQGVEMLPENDPCWFFCYDDGMSPEEAVREAISKGIVEHMET